MAVVVLPGGGVGDTGPFSASHTSNWVAKAGGLPPYVRAVARGLIEKGRVATLSEAIRLALGAIKRWAKGLDGVSHAVQLAAAEAWVQWETSRGKAHVNLSHFISSSHVELTSVNLSQSSSQGVQVPSDAAAKRKLLAAAVSTGSRGAKKSHTSTTANKRANLAAGMTARLAKKAGGGK